MKITLRKIDRSNWREAIEIKLLQSQETFVSSPVKSMAAAFVRQHGERYDYAPMAIYDGDSMVGYVATLCDPNTASDYWIDDIMIDARWQGMGYGRAAMGETIRFILGAYPRCQAVQLTCHRANERAARLYVSTGFRPTGQLNSLSGQPDYALTGDALGASR